MYTYINTWTGGDGDQTTNLKWTTNENSPEWIDWHTDDRHGICVTLTLVTQVLWSLAQSVLGGKGQMEDKLPVLLVVLDVLT